MLRLSGRRRNRSGRRESRGEDAHARRKCSGGSENLARLPADGKASLDEDEKLL